MYNGCILAVHAPDALRILGDQATSEELRVLGAFQYVYRYGLILLSKKKVWSHPIVNYTAQNMYTVYIVEEKKNMYVL